MRWLFKWGDEWNQALIVEAPSHEEALTSLSDYHPASNQVTEVPDDYELCSQCGYDHEYDGPGKECQELAFF